jgi:epoxyqueuosine reductase QueG
MNINQSSQIKGALLRSGASLVGFADLIGLPADLRHSMRYAVSVAVALDASIIAGIRDGPTQKYRSEYSRANTLLWELANHATNMIRDYGYEAIPKRATHAGIDSETQSTRLPHKTVATRAGLGWIGKCALLVTEKFGSAIRIATVLTDAELETATAIEDSRCGDCVLCVDSCPGKAPSGKEWNVNLDRDSFFDAFACAKAARERAVSRIGIDDTICGICISVCPWTMKYVKRKGCAQSK